MDAGLKIPTLLKLLAPDAYRYSNKAEETKT
jgi:hypothetical protein